MWFLGNRKNQTLLCESENIMKLITAPVQCHMALLLNNLKIKNIMLIMGESLNGLKIAKM